MRLFIAIEFTPKVKEFLYDMIQELKQQSNRGTFTRFDNLHLTLAFLGEMEKKRIPEVVEAMKNSCIGRKPFDLSIGGFGKFMTHGECLYWCGVRDNPFLLELQQSLVSNLKEQNIAVDLKPFQPHITLGRRCIMKKSFKEKLFSEQIDVNEMKVSTIHLMKSERIDGKLTYTSLHELNLANM